MLACISLYISCNPCITSVVAILLQKKECWNSILIVIKYCNLNNNKFSYICHLHNGTCPWAHCRATTITITTTSVSFQTIMYTEQRHTTKKIYSVLSHKLCVYFVLQVTRSISKCCQNQPTNSQCLPLIGPFHAHLLESYKSLHE